MQIELPENIVLNEKEYPLSMFSENVKKLVTIHTQWRSQLAEERLAMAKTEAAIRNLDMELTQLIMKEMQLDTQDAASDSPAGP